MATVVNFIDVTLRSAPSRTVNLASAQVLLTPTAPAFHVATDNTVSPPSITFTATLIGLDGPATFACSGGVLSSVAGSAATLAYADMSANSATVTASVTVNGQVYSAPCTISKMQDGGTGPTGPKGSDGAAGPAGAQTATAYLYQWSTATPAAPLGTSTFTWAGNTNSTYTANDGWSTTVPANPGTPLIKLYVAPAPITAAAGVVSSSVSYANAAIAAWSQNGANGASGMHAGAAIVYQWAATIPAGPVGAATYTWASGTFGAAPTGWSLTSGSAPSAGMTLWQAKVSLVDAATNTTTAFNWTAAGISAIGYAGGSGTSYVTAYCASSTATASGAPAATTGKASLPAADSGGIVGTWSATVPTLTAGQFMYQSDGLYDPATDKVTWSTPYWSSLKVGSLSAITLGVMGEITSGSFNIGNGIAHIDSTGAATFKAISIQDGNGNVLLSSGGAGTLPTAIGQAATTSTWAGTTGPGKPADNATNGAVINRDPNFTSSAGWSVSINSGGGLPNFGYPTDAPGAAAPRCIYPENKVGTGDAGFWALDDTLYTISPSRTYELAASIFADAGNARTFYLGVCFYDYQGGLIDSSVTGWGGGWSGYPIGNLSAAGGTFTHYAGSFGAGTTRAIPAGATQCRVGVILNYGASGSSGGRMAAQDLKLTDTTAVVAAATTSTWAGTTGPGKPADNATVGATIGLNLAGQLTKANMSTYIQSAAIDLAFIDKASITSLSALSANIGFLTNRPNGQGAGMDRAADTDQVFDTSGANRVKIGRLL